MQVSIFRKVAWHFYGEKCGAKQARVKSEIVKTEQESMLRKIATLSSIVAPPGLVNKFRLICRRYMVEELQLTICYGFRKNNGIWLHTIIQ